MEKKVCVRCLELIESLNCKDNCYGDKYYHNECFTQLNKQKLYVNIDQFKNCTSDINYSVESAVEPFLMKSYNNAMGEIKKQLDKSTNSKDLFDDNYIDKINWASDKLIQLTGKYKTISQIKAQIADIVSSENPGTQVDKLNELTDKLAKLCEETTISNNKSTDHPIKSITPTISNNKSTEHPIESITPTIKITSSNQKLVFSKNGDLVWLPCDDNGNIKPIKYSDYSHADY